MIKDFFDKQKLKKIKVFLKKGVVFKKAEFEGSHKIGENTNVRKSKIGLGSYICKNCCGKSSNKLYFNSSILL
ncbi:MAG: hypothetical protein ACRC5W_08225 [Cetobacterium sp.]